MHSYDAFGVEQIKLIMILTSPDIAGEYYDTRNRQHIPKSKILQDHNSRTVYHRRPGGGGKYHIHENLHDQIHEQR